MLCKYRHVICTHMIMVGFGLFVLGAAPAQAEDCVRMQKNGVIYYFFSNHSLKQNNPKQAAWRKPPTFLASSPRAQAAPKMLPPLIQEASQRYGLPPALIKAVIRVESNFNPGATSPKGAQGLMQLMPATAADLAVNDAYDVRENILAGSRYLYLLLEKFNHHLPHALAAYNAGPQRVEKWQAVPPIAETEDFVRNVCAQFLQYQTEKAGAP